MNLLFNLCRDWPESPEEWKNLFKEYWQHEQEEKKQLVALLQGVVNTLQQVYICDYS